jgi:hypothetical protein
MPTLPLPDEITPIFQAICQYLMAEAGSQVYTLGLRQVLPTIPEALDGKYPSALLYVNPVGGTYSQESSQYGEMGAPIMPGTELWTHHIVIATVIGKWDPAPEYLAALEAASRPWIGIIARALARYPKAAAWSRLFVTAYDYTELTIKEGVQYALTHNVTVETQPTVRWG